VLFLWYFVVDGLHERAGFSVNYYSMRLLGSWISISVKIFGLSRGVYGRFGLEIFCAAVFNGCIYIDRYKFGMFWAPYYPPAFLNMKMFGNAHSFLLKPNIRLLETETDTCIYSFKVQIQSFAFPPIPSINCATLSATPKE
jgi:hypothetical protein